MGGGVELGVAATVTRAVNIPPPDARKTGFRPANSAQLAGAYALSVGKFDSMRVRVGSD